VDGASDGLAVVPEVLAVGGLWIVFFEGGRDGACQSTAGGSSADSTGSNNCGWQSTIPGASRQRAYLAAAGGPDDELSVLAHPSRCECVWRRAVAVAQRSRSFDTHPRSAPLLLLLVSAACQLVMPDCEPFARRSEAMETRAKQKRAGGQQRRRSKSARQRQRRGAVFCGDNALWWLACDGYQYGIAS